jgi:hypothetical protein
VLILCPAAAGAARGEAPATIVMVGDVPSTGALEAARDEMPAAWRMARLLPEINPNPAPADESSALAKSYLEADFLRCLTQLQGTAFDVDRLLERDRRSEAARVGTLAAACALGAGDKPRARDLVRRMLVRDLDDADTLRQTTPEFQMLVDEERAAARRLARVTVEVQTNPARAAVHIDGVLRCRTSPCRAHVIGGEHIITTERLGSRARSLTAEIDHDQSILLALDEAPADDVRQQLAVQLASGADPTGIEISEAAATAFGARMLVLVWQERTVVHATAYDRAIDKVLAHVAIDTGPEAVPGAVRAVVHEERDSKGGKNVVRQPAFWLTTAGVALLTGTLVLLANRPVEVRHEIVFH